MQSRSVTNFLVPGPGGTNVMVMSLPVDGNINGGYGIDFRSLAQILLGELFIPQSCTIDASQIASTTIITFSIPAINFEVALSGGQSTTIQFPALTDLSVRLTASSGNPTIPTFWYNYPAMPVVIGAANVAATLATLPAAPLGQPVVWTPVTGIQTAVGPTIIFTPGSRFQLKSLSLGLLQNSTLAAPGISVVTISDGATVFCRVDPFIPSIALAANALDPTIYVIDFQNNPYLSAIAANNLTITLGTAFTAGGIRYNAMVTG